MTPSVAIIMRSKNEMPYVRMALEQLSRQTFRDYELFAVDSGSTDGSLEVLRDYCDPDHLAKILPEQYKPGKVLNDAIARTDHKLIVLLNADAIPQSSDWLENLLRPILGKKADASFSRQVARPDARFIVAYDYQRAYDPKNIDERSFSAVACAFRRELWERQRFRPTGYAEDLEWAGMCRNNGARIRFVENSVVGHSHNYTLQELFRKRSRQAAAFADVPSRGNQSYPCLRELVRDFLFACRKLKPHTIPYNIAYRITIHAGFRHGLRNPAPSMNA